MFHLLKLSDQSGVVINKLTGAWAGGDIAHVTKILECLRNDSENKLFPQLDQNMLDLIKHVGLRKKKQARIICDPSLAVIHIGHSCNLSCTYCYSPKDKNRITPRVAQQIAKFLGGAPSDLLIQFMGGEPLLHIPEMEFLIEALNESRQGRETTFGIQTNALLLNKAENLEFLRHYNIHFGISFDGPHGMSKARYGKEASKFELQIGRTIHELKSEGRGCGIICVVNHYNVQRLNELIEWCFEQGVEKLQLNPILPKIKGIPSDVLTSELSEAMVGAYRIWVDRNWFKTLAIDNFQALEDNLTSRNRPFMCRKYPCGAGINQLAFDLNGDIYPCDYMVGTARFKMGNVFTTPFSELRTNAVMEELSNISFHEGSGSCGECCFLSICGHCPSNSFFNSNVLNGPKASCQADAAVIREILINLLKNQEYADHVAAR